MLKPQTTLLGSILRLLLQLMLLSFPSVANCLGMSVPAEPALAAAWLCAALSLCDCTGMLPWPE